jgi:nucleoside-diphosphate-sugar epimerase
MAAKAKTALVTGSLGFVGKAMVRALRDRGYRVHGIDIKEDNTQTNSVQSNMDCRDFFRYTDRRYNLVVHLAAIVGGRTNIEGNPLSVASDLAIDSDMFQWALRTRPDHVVYYSSSAAYPVAYQYAHASTMHGPLKEEEIYFGNQFIGIPDLTYGWAKLTGEMLAGYAKDKGLNVHVFRPFSGYGEHQDFDYPMPSIVRRALLREDPLTVWSDAVRDFIHIDDVVNATLAAVDQDIQFPINLCTGIGTSFTELARLAADLVGYQPDIKVLCDKPTGVMCRVGNPSQMHTVYRPTITLKEGVSRVAEWLDQIV